MRIPYISLIAAGALTLGGCAYGDFGYGLGYGDYGYGGYGYGYGSPYYGGYGSPYFGWYDDYYYPGTGIYAYDTYRRPHVWNNRQRSYWMSHQKSGTRNPNWSGFDHRPNGTHERRRRDRD